MMKDKKLPENIAAKVAEWLSPEHSISHFWEQDGTFFIIARANLERGEFYCLRVFPIGEALQLSQDNIIYA